MIICVPTGHIGFYSDAPTKVVVSVHVPPMYIDNVHELIVDRALTVELARGPPKAA